ncbi:uncharacterized protein METZ01_LOCUS275377, partial [marine metagenome]
MNAISVGDEATIRLTIFVMLFLALAITERIFPKRRSEFWLNRWFNNLSL